MSSTLPDSVLDWANLKLLILDVDGVLTDGQLYFSDQHTELKAFSVQDGLGIRLLLRSGVEIAVITSRSSPLVEWRMQSLGVKHIYQGAHAKLPVFRQLMKELQIDPSQVAYMGDDWPDLPVMQQVGIPIAVANAVVEVSDRAAYHTVRGGGCGAVREVADLILKAKGRHAGELARYLSGDV